MAFSLVWTKDNLYHVRDIKYGEDFCSISIDPEVRIPEHQIEKLLNELVAGVNLLREDEDG